MKKVRNHGVSKQHRIVAVGNEAEVDDFVFSPRSSVWSTVATSWSSNQTRTFVLDRTRDCDCETVLSSTLSSLSSSSSPSASLYRPPLQVAQSVQSAVSVATSRDDGGRGWKIFQPRVSEKKNCFVYRLRLRHRLCFCFFVHDLIRHPSCSSFQVPHHATLRQRLNRNDNRQWT